MIDVKYNELLSAVKALSAANFATGEQWQVCHDLCANNEGTQAFDWVHAFIHRIEGDDHNARYWYQKARKSYPASDIQEEWQSLVIVLENESL